MKMRRNCVFKCKTFGIYTHRFPNPKKKPELFQEWLGALQGLELGERDPIKIYKNKRVCDRHFKPEQKSSGHRLIYNAKPSINFGEVCTSTLTILEEEHNYCIPRRTASNLTDAANEIIEPVSNEMYEDPLNFDEIDDGQTELPIENPIEIGASDQEEKIYSWQKNSEFLDINQDECGQELDYREEEDINSKYCDNNLGSTANGEDNQNTVFRCDFCKEKITDYRYTCVQCNELDLCSGCESRGEHDQHYVLRIPPLRPYDETREILASIRRLLNLKSDPFAEKDDNVSVKSEIKSESGEPIDDFIVEPFEGDNYVDINSFQEGTTTPESGLENDNKETVETGEMNASYQKRAKNRKSRKNDDKRIEQWKDTIEMEYGMEFSTPKKKVKMYDSPKRHKKGVTERVPADDGSMLLDSTVKSMLNTVALLKPVPNEQSNKPDAYVRLAKGFKKTGSDKNS